MVMVGIYCYLCLKIMGYMIYIYISKWSNNSQKTEQWFHMYLKSSNSTWHKFSKVMQSTPSKQRSVSICWSTVIYQHPQLLWQGICVHFGDSLSQTWCFTKAPSKQIVINHCLTYVVNPCTWSPKVKCQPGLPPRVGRFGPVVRGALEA